MPRESIRSSSITSEVAAGAAVAGAAAASRSLLDLGLDLALSCCVCGSSTFLHRCFNALREVVSSFLNLFVNSRLKLHVSVLECLTVLLRLVPLGFLQLGRSDNSNLLLVIRDLLTPDFLEAVNLLSLAVEQFLFLLLCDSTVWAVTPFFTVQMAFELSIFFVQE